jgi:FkbM family methyltransferase
MKEQLKRLVRRAIAPFDLELKRLSRTPDVTLLGLKKFSIQSILDIGANAGQYARILSQHFPEARIYSFEPVPSAFAQLSNAPIRHCMALPIAIGDHCGSAIMEEHTHHSASSSFLKATELSREYYPGSRDVQRTEVRMLTLDAAVDEFQIPLRADLLVKMDVQGYENRVIRGGASAFRVARACLTEICLDTLYEGQATFLELVGQFAEHGLHYAGNIEQSAAEDGHIIFVDALFVRK